METKRFRNHFSIIFERLGSGIILILLLIIGNADELIEDIARAHISVIPVLIGVSIFLLTAGILFGWQYLVWKKTWIILDEDTITIEKNTIHSTKNTIGIKNISNVNTEQNIFEMIIGTCKVKLDTNSLSTANQTDVKIVLKKADAESLRQTLVKRMNEFNTGTKFSGNVTAFDDENERFDEEATMKEMIWNGIYSMNVISVLWILFCFVLFVFNIITFVQEDLKTGNIADGILVIFGIGFVTLTSTIGFIQKILCMYGFKVKREDDRIHIKYGLFKKVDFAIPVNKIHAIQIHQTLIARVFHKYAVEMINVGMGDEENANAYFTFYASKEKTLKSIEKLLPEFAQIAATEFEKQPKSMWIMKVIKDIVWAGIIAVAFFVLQFYVEEITTELFIIGLSAIILITVICQILSYNVTGISIHENYLGLQEGMFGTSRTFIKFDKIQYVTLNQNLVTKKLGILKGDVTILAMLGKGLYSIPYMKEEKADVIYKELLG